MNLEQLIRELRALGVSESEIQRLRQLPEWAQVDVAQRLLLEIRNNAQRQAQVASTGGGGLGGLLGSAANAVSRGASALASGDVADALMNLIARGATEGAQVVEQGARTNPYVDQALSNPPTVNLNPPSGGTRAPGNVPPEAQGDLAQSRAMVEQAATLLRERINNPDRLFNDQEQEVLSTVYAALTQDRANFQATFGAAVTESLDNAFSQVFAQASGAGAERTTGGQGQGQVPVTGIQLDNPIAKQVFDQSAQYALAQGADLGTAIAYARVALAIAYGESGLDPNAENNTMGRTDLPAGTQPERSIGLFQLNFNGGRGTASGLTPEQARDPTLNIQASMPDIWRTFQALGGLEAMRADPVGFTARVYQQAQGSVAPDIETQIIPGLALSEGAQIGGFADPASAAAQSPTVSGEEAQAAFEAALAEAIREIPRLEQVGTVAGVPFFLPSQEAVAQNGFFNPATELHRMEGGGAAVASLRMDPNTGTFSPFDTTGTINLVVDTGPSRTAYQIGPEILSGRAIPSPELMDVINSGTGEFFANLRRAIAEGQRERAQFEAAQSAATMPTSFRNGQYYNAQGQPLGTLSGGGSSTSTEDKVKQALRELRSQLLAVRNISHEGARNSALNALERELLMLKVPYPIGSIPDVNGKTITDQINSLLSEVRRLFTTPNDEPDYDAMRRELSPNVARLGSAPVRLTF